MLCAEIVAVPLALDPGADVAFTVPKVLLSHGLAYVLTAVMAGLLVRFGRSFFVWSWLHVCVAAFLAASALATAFAADPFLAAFGTHARMLGLGTIADWAVLYLAVVLLIRTRVEAFTIP